MAVYSIFGQPPAPASVASDTGAYTFGMQFTSTQAGTVTAVWFYSDTLAAGNAVPDTIALWAVTGGGTGTLVHSETASWSGAAGAGWLRAAFSSPPAVSPATSYKISVKCNGGSDWYSATAHYWDTGSGSGGVTNGPLTAPNNAGADNGQDTFFNSTVLTYPNGSFNAANYWVDLEFTPSASTASAGLATGTGTALQPAAGNTVTATAGLATGTGTALSPATSPASYTLFGQASNGTVVSDFNPYTFGVAFTVSTSATMNAVWFYSPATAQGLPQTIALYQTTGTLTALLLHNETATWSGTFATGWVRAAFATPQALTAGVHYKAAVLKTTSSLWYSSTAHYWDTTGPGAGGITSGVLSAANSAGADGGQDSYHQSNTLTYPTNNFNATNYWIDLEVSVSSGTPVTANAVLATGTGTALQPGTTGSTTASAGLATGTGTALRPLFSGKGTPLIIAGYI